MGHTVTLQVPENLYKAIQLRAIQHGQTPDSLVTEWLAEAIRRAETAEQDPLVRLFGTISSDVTDVAEQHDYYISQAVSQELHDGE